MLSNEDKKYISLAPFFIPSLFEIYLEKTLQPFFIKSQPIQVKKGHIFLHPEEQVHQIFFLTKGIIAESSSNANGLEKITLFFPCYPLALAPCIHKQPIIYSSYAYVDSEVIPFSYEAFIQMLQSSQPLLEDILRLIAFESRNVNNIILQNYSYSTYEKVYQAVYFYDLTSSYYAPLKKLRLSQQLLAGLAGVHRTSVNHAIKALKESGIILVEKRTFTILQKEALKELAFPSVL